MRRKSNSEVIMADKKEFSARKFMAIWYSITYGIIMVFITIAFVKKIIIPETYIALLGGFALIAKEIANDYFDKDRTNGKPVEPPIEIKPPVITGNIGG